MATGDPFAGGHYRRRTVLYVSDAYSSKISVPRAAFLRIRTDLEEFLYNYHNSNALPLCT